MNSNATKTTEQLKAEYDAAHAAHEKRLMSWGYDRQTEYARNQAMRLWLASKK